MKIYLECIPCMVKQIIDASRMPTDSIEEQNDIMVTALDLLRSYQSFDTSPEVVRQIHQIVKDRTGAADPYRTIKQRDIKTALELVPRLERFIEQKQDAIYWSLKISAAGNVLDSAVCLNPNNETSPEAELEKPFSVCDIDAFKSRLENAKTLLVIGDNAGETVFDRCLLQRFEQLRIVYAVRSAPIINDAVMKDAYASGLEGLAEIVSTGCDLPGVILNECSEEFRNIFYGSDLVISKGQGNYETLSDCDREIFFVLKAKCAPIADLLGVSVNSYILKYHQGAFGYVEKPV